MGLQENVPTINVDRDIRADEGMIRYEIVLPALTSEGAEQRAMSFMRRDATSTDVEVVSRDKVGEVAFERNVIFEDKAVYEIIGEAEI